MPRILHAYHVAFVRLMAASDLGGEDDARPFVLRQPELGEGIAVKVQNNRQLQVARWSTEE